MQKEDKIKEFVKRAVYLGIFLAISSFYVVLNRYTGREKELITLIDNLIPFNKYFVLVYVFWYAYIAIFLIYFCIYDEKKYYKILIGLNSGMIIAYLIYILYPTMVPRPVFYPGDGVVDGLFKWLYIRDNPFNCFPSIHVMNTVIIAIYVHKDNLYLNKYIKVLSTIIAGAIIYSTLAIKQHVILDAVCASGIAYGLYLIIDYREIYAKIYSKFRRFQGISET